MNSGNVRHTTWIWFLRKLEKLGCALVRWARGKIRAGADTKITAIQDEILNEPTLTTNQRAMNQKVTIEGQWWIFGPDEPSHFGVVEYDPEESTILTVKIPQNGGIEAALSLFENRGGSVPLNIFGADKNNQRVSLFGCNITNSTANFGQHDFVITVMVVVCGLHSPSWDELELDRICAELSLFHNWIGISRVSVQSGPETIVKIAERKVTEYDLNAGVKLKFWPTHGINHAPPSALSVREGHGIEFRFTEPNKVKETVHTYVQSFRRFLSLAVGKPVFVDKLYAQQTVDGAPCEVTILLGNPGVSEANRKLQYPHMRASYREIQATFGQIIRRWYELESTIADVLNLYFATVFNRSLYIHQQFLFLAQALEVYHRTSPNFDNMVQPKADFRARKKRIVEAVPDEKDWLNEKLGHANEKTLAQRLDELLKTHAGDVSQFIQDTKVFADFVRHTRNHFTHYGTDEEQMDKVAKGIDLIRITYQMEALVEICVLKDLGITGSPIARIINSLNAHSYFSV
jgi:hypothetical protein